jgi:hypothetical protein
MKVMPVNVLREFRHPAKSSLVESVESRHHTFVAYHGRLPPIPVLAFGLAMAEPVLPAGVVRFCRLILLGFQLVQDCHDISDAEAFAASASRVPSINEGP